jgi:hypothetical protein
MPGETLGLVHDQAAAAPRCHYLLEDVVHAIREEADVTIGERGQCGELPDLAAVQGLGSGAQCTAWWAQLGQLLPRVC